MITKPMLAETIEDVSSISYPLMASPKLDGIRCLVVNGKCVSRTFKPIPNKYVRETIERDLGHLTLDGELMVDGLPFNEVSSAIMSMDGEPKFTYHVFDYIADSLTEPFKSRISRLSSISLPSYVSVVGHVLISNPEELGAYEAKVLSKGYEGVMTRLPSSPYKCGRATLKQQYLLKLKQFSDSEAQVIGFEELMHNNNEAKLDAFGRTERSSHKDNLVPSGMLGALIVRDLKTGVEFSVGTGFDHAQRAEIWLNQDKYLNQIISYKSQPAGQHEKPRFPVWRGFRSKEDMGG